MKNTGVNIDHYPAPVVLEPLPDGGAWLRMYGNIEEVATPYPDNESSPDNANKQVSWQAIEVVMYVEPADLTELTVDYINANFDTYWNMAEAWIPANRDQKKPTVEELAAELKAVRLENQLLTEQSQMLTDCILEMSEIVYA